MHLPIPITFEVRIVSEISDVQKAQPAATAVESPLHADAYSHLPSPWGGDTTWLAAGVGAGIGLTKAGLLTEGVTGAVVSRGLAYGGIGLAYGIGAGLTWYELDKHHSGGIASLGMLAGAGVGLARAGVFTGSAAASTPELLTIAARSGLVGLAVGGGIGILAYELDKHHVL